MKYLLLIVIFAFVCYEAINAAILCRSASFNFCDKVDCSSEPKCCPKGKTLTKGGFCLCCNVCATILKEGEQCPVSLVIGGPPPTVYCEEGLQCINSTCQAAQ
ncbi:fungal protease inhibitor-1-like [Aethina tumida]|uniref:fungal protease inhibitor-1-like n=1 Tax=Aethina tumida TaxID=116153 RepID=UPI00096AF867|nr:fungal protease inhibitor-1-like [Aethina tumida]